MGIDYTVEIVYEKHSIGNYAITELVFCNFQPGMMGNII